MERADSDAICEVHTCELGRGRGQVASVGRPVGAGYCHAPCFIMFMVHWFHSSLKAVGIVFGRVVISWAGVVGCFRKLHEGDVTPESGVTRDGGNAGQEGRSSGVHSWARG